MTLTMTLDFSLLGVVKMFVMVNVCMFLAYVALRILASAVFTSWFETKKKYKG